MKKGADDAFTLGGKTIERDSVVRVDLELAALPVGIALPMTVIVARGRRPGPRLFVTAAIHGDELAGILVTREVLDGIQTADLRGTLVAVPVVNAFGLLRQTRERASYNIYLAERYRPNELPRRSLRAWYSFGRRMLRLWLRLSQVRSREQFAEWLRVLGWHVGLLEGSVKYKAPPL